MTPVILASASTARASLLRGAGVEFEIVPAAVEEDRLKASLRQEGASPRDVADALSELKAVRVSAPRPQAIVVGADQILEYDGEVLNKPKDRAALELQLRRLRGGRHKLVTAAVLAQDGRAFWRHVAETTLWMRNFSEAFLEWYLAQEGENLFGCVGGYRLEGAGVQLFERIEGDYFSILGLPLVPLLAALREQGALLS